VVKAAVAGHPEAQVHLAGIYLRGEGEEPDLVLAYYWSLRAALAGVEEAARLRDAIAAQLSAEQRDEVRALLKRAVRVAGPDPDR
jgi:TPR repeat protein